VNKELQVRIRELELQLAGETRPGGSEAADYGEVSEESATVIAMIKDLHGQIDAAQELREALEADRGAMKEKLAEERTVRAELEARVKLLEARAALGDQLREDLSFVEEERNAIARRLEQAASQLANTTEERNRLAEQKIADDARLKELQSEKITLEAKALNLGETVADVDHLRQELGGAREESQRAKETVQSLKGKLEATEVAKNVMEHDLTTTREQVREQSEQLDGLNKNLATAHAQLADRRAELDQREVENANLVELNKRAERELKTLTEWFESAKRELDLSKKALRDIRTAAIRTTSQIREHASGV
jgi:chromosome segregation ATPase